MNRSAAKRTLPGHVVRHSLEDLGIVVRCPSNAELAEEAPFAYEDKICFHANSVLDGAFQRQVEGARVRFTKVSGTEAPQASMVTLAGRRRRHAKST
jgi:hypothetical protein